MAKITIKGFRGQREDVLNAGDVKQSAIDTANGLGNRNDSASKSEPQADVNGASKRVHRILVDGRSFATLQEASRYMMTR